MSKNESKKSPLEKSDSCDISAYVATFGLAAPVVIGGEVIAVDRH